MAKKIKWTVEMADSQIKCWQNVKNIILRSDIQENDDFDTMVFKLYLQLTAVKDVANALSNVSVP